MNKLPFPDPLSKTWLFYLSPIKVLNDGQMETLLTLPLCLHGVAEEFPEWPIRPLQQLVVQQQCVGSFCKTNYSMALINTKHIKQTKCTEMWMLFLRGTFLMVNWFFQSIRQMVVVAFDRVTIIAITKIAWHFHTIFKVELLGLLLESENTKETEIK